MCHTRQSFRRPLLFLLPFASLLASAAAPCAEPPTASSDAGEYAALIRALGPIAYWRFGETDGPSVRNSMSGTDGDEAASDNPALNGTIEGTVALQQSGPRPERFPLFAADNTASGFGSQHGFVRVSDPGTDSVLDFGAGDSITLEAWVNPRTLGNGQQRYILGKGRTQRDGVARDNQNYALRLTGVGGTARMSFLFRNARNRRGEQNDFHRWTADRGFSPGTGWHHVVLVYTFGDSESLQAWVDGQLTGGSWDLGKATDAAPFVDDDELWIGSSMGGQLNSTFSGDLDEVALYRRRLNAAEVASHYKAKPYPLAETTQELPADGVLVEILEGAPEKTWDFAPLDVTESYTLPAFAFVGIPRKYSERAVQIDRELPFLVRATGLIELPAGEHDILVRARHGSRLFLDGEQIAETAFFSIPSSGHGKIRHVAKAAAPKLRVPQTGDQETLTTIRTDGGRHRFQFEFFVGGKNLRPETGETCVAIGRDGEGFRLLSPVVDVALRDAQWFPFLREQQQWLSKLNARRREQVGRAERKYWDWRHEQARAIVTAGPAPQAPAAAAEAAVHNEIDAFINAELKRRDTQPLPLLDDWAFARRAALDVIGTIPTPDLLESFLQSTSANPRAEYVETLLAQPGWADHWVGYWQDVLAENPNIVNPTLNNSGPFRWWIHESFLDNKPVDRLATELILMEGSRYYGGPGGFAMATENDSPMAAKAHIVAQAFLGINLKCARCHDAPFQDARQSDLFALAGMLNRGAESIPETSSIPLDDEALDSLIVTVSVKPGEAIPPEWPYPELTEPQFPPGWIRNPDDARELLAALVTSPHNPRFARVIVNRLWHRLLGRGLVEPVDDWDQADPSHPELLDWLARELVVSGYDLKHVARLILNSHTYQRQAVDEAPVSLQTHFAFAGPLRRRMTAEQVVDSLFVACGKPLNAGVVNIDADGARPANLSLNLGRPRRAWQFASLSNERDRPSLSLPLAEPFVNTLEAFGWRASRQDPQTERDHSATVLQPAALANGVLGNRFTRLSNDSAFTQLALDAESPQALLDAVFRRALSRPPRPAEREVFEEMLRPGFDWRIRTLAPEALTPVYPQTTGVSWSNHLSPEANDAQIALQKRVQAGDPPTPALEPAWRERLEDVLWAIVNSPEFVMVP